MKIIKDKISIKELKQMSEKMAGLVKAVVDVDKEIMAIDAAMHADEEKILLEAGSAQKNLWGINLYPDLEADDWIEFDSMINIRSWQNNRTRGVEDEDIQKKIRGVVNKLIRKD